MCRNEDHHYIYVDDNPRKKSALVESERHMNTNHLLAKIQICVHFRLNYVERGIRRNLNGYSEKLNSGYTWDGDI